MDPERFARIKRLLLDAQELGPAERAAFLDEACAGDPGLRGEIESILAYEHGSLALGRPSGTRVPLRAAQDPPAAGSSDLPRRIQHYEVRAELGRGGMGVVYRAWDPDLEREVALKVLPAQWAAHPDRVTRFAAEARLLASINHPNIARILTIEQDGDIPFLSMELVAGRSLEAMIAEGPLSLEIALTIARQVASALEAAHSRGVIHRDVKPLNVMVTTAGRVKVLDFGIAKALWGEEAWARSAPGAEAPAWDLAGLGSGIIGTPGYMSPEQVTGEAVSARTDVWAIGCLLFACLVGEPPFAGESVSDILRATVGADAPLDRLPRSTPSELVEMIRRCLERDPIRRPGTMSAVRRAVIEAMESLELDHLVAGDSIGSTPTNLPRRLTTFIGRKHEIEEVGALMDRHQLVTLVGVGGCGKTRLSLEVAGAHMRDYPDGVWQVELVALRAPSFVSQAVMSALGVEQRSGNTVVETVVAHLRDKRSLLILDNCEHVLDGCIALIAEVLLGAPHLRILATSRERLGLDGEQVYAVPPLSIENADDAGQDAGGDAIELFLARARSANASFQVEGPRRALVARICRRLDGLPLALELAAARIQSMSLEDLALGLEEGSGMLAGGDRAIVPRHQTLKRVIDWSHDHLETSARQVLRRMSVFAGGCTLEAAEAVCRGETVEEWELLDVLTTLVDKSLIERGIEDGESGARVRFRMLETVREYARERLAEAGEVAAVQERHRDHFLALAELAGARLRGAETQRWIRRLDIEQANIMAALEWKGGDDGGQKALRLAASIWRYWNGQGYLSLGREVLTGVLALDAGKHASIPRGVVLHTVGALALAQGDQEAARKFFADSLAMHRQLGDRAGMATVIASEGSLEQLQGDLVRARALFEESLRLRREVGDRQGIAGSLGLLGRLAFAQGDFAAAERFHEESLGLRREIADIGGIASSLGNLANVKFGQGKYQEGTGLLEESLVMSRQVGDRRGIAALLNNLGTLKYMLGDLESAQRFLAESLTLRLELGESVAVARSMVAFGQVAAAHGQSERGVRLMAAAAAAMERLRSTWSPKDKIEIEETIAGLEKALDREAFAREWETGSSLSMDEAIELALENGTQDPLRTTETGSPVPRGKLAHCQ